MSESETPNEDNTQTQTRSDQFKECARSGCVRTIAKRRYCSIQCFDTASYYDVKGAVPKVRELAAEGLNVQQIANEMNKSQTWIWQLLVLTNIDVANTQYYTEREERAYIEDRDKIIECYKLGMSFDKIAEETGYTAHLCTKALVEEGVHELNKDRTAETTLYNVAERLGKVDELREKILGDDQ